MKPVVAVAILCFSACASISTSAQDNLAKSTILISNDAVNQNCEIVLEKSKSAPQETTSGKIVRFDDKTVVLNEATRTLRVENKVPILGSIPYVGRMFQNTGMAIEKVPGELVIDRTRIRSIKFAK